MGRDDVRHGTCPSSQAERKKHAQDDPIRFERGGYSAWPVGRRCDSLEVRRGSHAHIAFPRRSGKFAAFLLPLLSPFLDDCCLVSALRSPSPCHRGDMRTLATSSCCTATPGEVCRDSRTRQQAHSSRPSGPLAFPPPPADDPRCTEPQPWRKGSCPPRLQKNRPSSAWGSSPDSERGPTHRPGERNKHLSGWEKTLRSPETNHPVGFLAPSMSRSTKKEDSTEEGLPERKA